jgi:predicted restriction endonuclease
MITNISNYISKHIINTPITIIYNKLKQQYNEHDIKFVLLTHFDCDIDTHITRDVEEHVKRNYQTYLRKRALEQYNNKCVISGIYHDILLEVAHIIPVNKCINDSDKSNVNNTLLLWMDIHKYFDNYQITINPSTSRVEAKCDYLMQFDGLKIQLNNETKIYLQHHYKCYCSSS